MIFVDVSQLSRFLRVGKAVSGIQRLTLNAFAGLRHLVGDNELRALIYFPGSKGFFELTPKEFFDGAGGRPAVFTSADRLLFIEWFWNQEVFEATLTAGAAVGAKRFRFIHDVIPVACPQFVRPANTKQFQQNASRALAAADVVLTNSQYSKLDILRHFPESQQRPIEVLKLPHEFTAVGKDGGIVNLGRSTPIASSAVRPKIGELAGKTFALMVGTLEERKNTLLAVKAWQRIAGKFNGAMPKLALVGFYSAHSLPYTASLILRLGTSSHTVHFSDCSDIELAWLYQHCKFTIYISQYEGWGLPIGESLWFGKPVVTQKLTSLEEVGGEHSNYVVASSKNEFDNFLIDQIQSSGQFGSYREAPPVSTLRSWSAFSHQLNGILVSN